MMGPSEKVGARRRFFETALLIQFTLVWSGVSDALRTIPSDLLRDFACAGINRAWSRGFIAGAGEDRWSD
jgi:hypothetical protein